MIWIIGVAGCFAAVFALRVSDELRKCRAQRGDLYRKGLGYILAIDKAWKARDEAQAAVTRAEALLDGHVLDIRGADETKLREALRGTS